MVTTLPVQPAWTANAVNTVKIDLGDLATHTVRVMVADAAIGRVWVAPSGIVNATHHAVPRLFVLGDSMTQGGVSNTGAELGSWLPRFAGSVGVTDYWNGGIGGTDSSRATTDTRISRAGPSRTRLLPTPMSSSSVPGTTTRPPESPRPRSPQGSRTCSAL